VGSRNDESSDSVKVGEHSDYQNVYQLLEDFVLWSSLLEF
jgi:hypothetical protein